MATYAELAGKLLEDAAAFFRNLGEHNESLREKMIENAIVFEQIGALVADEPFAMLRGTKHCELAGRLLTDSAGFFRTLAEQNEAIREQMESNADIYEQLGIVVAHDPFGVPPDS